LRRIALRRISLENTALRRIALRRIADVPGPPSISDILDCDTFPGLCLPDDSNTATLFDAVADCLPQDPVDNPGELPDGPKCALLDDADLGTLLDLLKAAGLLGDLELLDLLLAFIASDDVPWEAVDLEGAKLQNIGDPLQPTFDYVATITVREGPADLTAEFDIPDSFALAFATGDPAATLCPVPAGDCMELAPTDPESLIDPTYEIPNVGSGEWELRVPVRAGLTVEIGTMASVDVTARRADQSATASAGPAIVDVVAVAGATAGSAPVIGDGSVRLGHVATDLGIDLYSFEAPPGSTGGAARILLSNIPEGVDYDLSVYSERPASLRNPPQRSLNALGDIGYDLDPSTQVLSTDLVSDVVIDAPTLFGVEGQALRDISSRRSNNDEEVTIPALVAGNEYFVAVSSYLGITSPKPYGLRVRLDTRTALPECAVWTTANSVTASAAVPGGLAIDGDTNVLYVTNWQRLAAEGSTAVADDVLDAIAGTTDVNGVTAGLLLVDGLPAWGDWDDRCDPEQRNDVVRAIGKAIDTAIDGVENAGGAIEHLVIVGGDGVVPMAAVPDLTTYSNESTFARDVLTATGESNEVAAALGSGYLLSDDPYATSAGISILNGDHELYLPDRSIGRLVETPSQILGQLENFATYDGQIDVTTLNAAVTGYDFLTDGAQEVIEGLDSAFSVQALNDDEWDAADFLELLDSGPFDVLSPNAHFDFESLLPAAADGNPFYSVDDLVLSTQVAGLTNSPTGSVIFTMGCHAGLSVSDVQLGFTGDDGILDWAEMFGQGDNQFIGHTTYGYGDTQVVAYSERLAAIYARYLADMALGTPGAPTSLGEALQRTKTDYLSSTLVLTPYDEKVLQSFTYYGLPMYGLGGSGMASAAALTKEAAGPTGPASADAPDAQGRVPVSIALTIGTTPGPAVLNRVYTDEGSYYTVDGDTIVAPYRPVQPLVDVSLQELLGTGPDNGYQGFLITRLVSRDVADFEPRYATPVKDSGELEGTVESLDASFPTTLQRISGPVGAQRLLVAAGQYQGAGASAQRLFTEIDGTLLPYSGPTAGERDEVAPRFLTVDGRRISNVSGGQEGVQFDIVTDDTATRVVVLYRETGSPAWLPLELAGRDNPVGRAWFASAPLTAVDSEVEFFVQSVDASGNVGVTSNKIENFLAADETVPGTLDITFVGPADGFAEPSFYASGAEFEIVGDSEAITFSIDSSEEPCTYSAGQTITIVGPDDAELGDDCVVFVLDAGAHVIFAEDTAGNRAYRFFILDPEAPTITVTPEEATRNDDGQFVRPVTIRATDDSSGVATIEWEYCDVATPESEVCLASPVEGEFTSGATEGVIELPGSSTVRLTVTATDRVGNVASLVETILQSDATPPTVEIELSPDPGEGWSNQNVTVTISATDDDSGVASIEYRLNPTDEADAWVEYTEPLTLQHGVSTVEARATDVAGNTSDPVSRTVKVDLVDPIPTITLNPDPGAGWSKQAVQVTITATDVGSGVETIEYRLNGAATWTTYTSPLTLNSGESTVEARATDVAGNTSDPVSRTVKVDLIDPSANLSVTWTDRDGDGLIGLDDTATATFSCADAPSGIASCVLRVNGVQRASTSGSPSIFTFTPTQLGTQRFEVVATDNAGRTATAVREFTVGYRVCLMYDPTQPKNPGSNYTIKIRLCDAAGNNLSNRNITLTALTIDGTILPGPNFQGNSNSGFTFRWNSTDRSYIYNLDTTGLSTQDEFHRLYFTTAPVPDRSGLPATPLPEASAPFTIR
jgi:hypothetical protein